MLTLVSLNQFFVKQLFHKDFPSGSDVKNPPAKQETKVQPLGWEDPLEKEVATHFSILAWRIPWAEELGGGYSLWGHKEAQTTE